MSNEQDYKNTLNLPKTDFAMQANLAKREPAWIAACESEKLYERIEAETRDRPVFRFVDGPPYANGDIHIGHAVNKVLKDMILKSARLDGYRAPFTPGWDCHGLPIELQVEKKHGKVGVKLDAAAFRAQCREYAGQQIDRQREDFKRLGIFADWDRPYLTMQPAFEAEQLRVLGRWMRMITIPNQSSVAKAFLEFDDKDRMKPSGYYNRIVDVMEELMKFTLLTRDNADFLVDRYSERVESAEQLMERVNQRSL